MSTQNKNGSNGTVTPKPEANGNSKAVATVVTLPAKREEEKPKPVAKELQPVEDRILRVQQLGDLVEKHEALSEALKKLNSFKLASDGNKDLLKITDSKGREFSTTHSNVIADVIETLKISTAEKISAVEKLLVF
jgi:hypothetical protein